MHKLTLKACFRWVALALCLLTGMAISVTAPVPAAAVKKTSTGEVSQKQKTVKNAAALKANKAKAKKSIKQTEKLLKQQTREINALSSKKTKLEKEIAKREAARNKLRQSGKSALDAELKLGKAQTQLNKLNSTIRSKQTRANQTYNEHIAAKRVVAEGRQLKLLTGETYVAAKGFEKAKAKLDAAAKKKNEIVASYKSGEPVMVGTFMSRIAKAEKALEAHDEAAGGLSKALIKQNQLARDYNDSVASLKAAKAARKGPALSDPQLAADAAAVNKINDSLYKLLDGF